MKNLKYLKIVYWFFLLVLVVLLHSQNILNSDEGIILEGSWNMFNGKILYNDFFEFITPGSFYFIYFIWTLFSPSYLSAKIASLLLLYASSFLIYKMSNEFNKNRYNFIAPIIFIASSSFWPIINHNIHNLFFLCLASFYFIKGLKNNNKINFIISGLSAGLAILFLQQKGIAILTTTIFYLMSLWILEKNQYRLKQTWLFALSASIPISILFLKWSAHLLYNNLIKFSLENYISFNKLNYSFFFFFLILTILVAIILKSKKSKRINFLLLLQFFLLLTTLARPDPYHVLLIIFPLYILFPQIIQKIIQIKNWLKYLYLAIITIIILLIIYPSVYFLLFHFPAISDNKQTELIEYIQKNCPRENDLFAAPFSPGLYFETKKINFTPYYLLMTGLQKKEIFREVRNLLENNQPKCIVMNYQIAEKFNYSKDNLVDKYIAEKYQLQKKIQNDLIFIKK